MTNEEALRLAVTVAHGIEEKFASWSGPQNGSELHADDQVWPLHPASEVARSNLLAGVAHLKGALTLLSAGFEGPPLAYNSLLRGALLGSCQALWVLGPDDSQTRQARALRISDDEYSHRIGFHRTQAGSIQPERARHADRWLSKWTTTRKELKEVRASLPKVEDTTTTRIMERVAAEQFEPDEDGHAQLVGAWQSTSSSVHGLTWGLFVRPGMKPVLGQTYGPLIAFESEPEVDDAVDMFLLCARLIGQAGTQLLNRSADPA